jgi:hypothetical protein
MTEDEAAAFARRRGLNRLTAAHLQRLRTLAASQPDTLDLRRALTDKTVEPAYGPIFFRTDPKPDDLS